MCVAHMDFMCFLWKIKCFMWFTYYPMGFICVSPWLSQFIVKKIFQSQPTVCDFTICEGLMYSKEGPKGKKGL